MKRIHFYFSSLVIIPPGCSNLFTVLFLPTLSLSNSSDLLHFSNAQIFKSRDLKGARTISKSLVNIGFHNRTLRIRSLSQPLSLKRSILNRF